MIEDIFPDGLEALKLYTRKLLNASLLFLVLSFNSSKFYDKEITH